MNTATVKKKKQYKIGVAPKTWMDFSLNRGYVRDRLTTVDSLLYESVVAPIVDKEIAESGYASLMRVHTALKNAGCAISHFRLRRLFVYKQVKTRYEI